MCFSFIYLYILHQMIRVVVTNLYVFWSCDEMWSTTLIQTSADSNGLRNGNFCGLKNLPHSPSAGSNSVFLGRRGVIWCPCRFEAVQELLRAEPESVSSAETAALLSNRKPWEEQWTNFDKSTSREAAFQTWTGLSDICDICDGSLPKCTCGRQSIATPAAKNDAFFFFEIPKKRPNANRTGADAGRGTPAESLAVLSFLDVAEACRVQKRKTQRQAINQVFRRGCIGFEANTYYTWYNFKEVCVDSLGLPSTLQCRSKCQRREGSACYALQERCRHVKRDSVCAWHVRCDHCKLLVTAYAHTHSHSHISKASTVLNSSNSAAKFWFFHFLFSLYSLLR